MKLLVAIVGSLLLLAVAAFCVFGLLATFEPADRAARHLVFRIGYIVIGTSSVAGAGFLVASAVSK